MKPRLLLLAAAATLTCLAPVIHVPVRADVRRPPSLTALVGPNSLTRDTNGDGLADAFAARVVVPALPSLADIEAATNLAARLGYDTTALSLPIVVRDSEVEQPSAIAAPILVGRENRYIKQLIDNHVIEIAALKPGQGLIAAVASPLGGGDGLVVVGGDDEGTVNAGVELAARLPRVWGMTGITLSAIQEQAVRYLRSRGVNAADAMIASLLVDSEKRGVARVALRVEVPDADGAKAARLFEDLDAAHRRGQGPRTLNFTNVATTAIEIVAGGRPFTSVAVSRTGLNQRTLTPPIDPDELAPDSPGDRGAPAQTATAEASRAFDLSNAFSIDGWYGDAYADLIPDRTDASIVLGGASDSLPAAHVAARLALETTGITLPLTRIADKVRAPERETNPILVGQSNALVQRLARIGKADIDGLQPGEGVVQVVPRAFGGTTATVVAGAAGTEAAATYLARRAPYVWDNARGSIALSDVALQVNRFLQARSAAGQASQIDVELAAIAADVKDKTLESMDVKLYVEHADAALDTYIADRLQATTSVPPKVSSVGINDPVTVFDDTLQVPWEVDEFDLQKLTPNHMLHAGRYSALGMDVASQVGLTDPLLPESLVRTRVWRDWLPDIYLNPHGYPSHEWVQPFAGYVPPGFRTYLSTRGWYTTVGTLRDPRYPNHAEAVEALRESIVREINANPDVRAMDLRAQARYRKWAYGFGPYVYNQEIYKDTAIYYSDPETGEPSGSRRFGAGRGGGPSTGGEGGGPAGGTGRFSMSAWPQVTFFSGGTEAPDETAQAEWLNLVAKAGFSYLMANVKYLRDGQYSVHRIEEDAARDRVSLTTIRVRPVLPGRAAPAPHATSSTGGK